MATAAFASLRHRNFRLFFTGQATSLVGTWMQNVAEGWLVLSLTNSTFLVGLVAALSSLPVLLFSLPAGVYADRANKHRIIITCQAGMLLLAAMLTVLVATKLITAWEVALFAFLQGCLSSFEIPARQSFFVELVDREDLTNAIALNSSAYNVARILGPSIAGVMIAKVGMAACYGLNAVSYLAVIVGLLMMRLPRWERPMLAGNAFSRFREGLRFARSDRRVWALIVMTGMFGVFGFPFVVLLPVFARNVLHVGPSGLGLMSASVGVGAVVAAFGLAAASYRVRRGMLIRWSGVLFGLGVVAFAFSRAYPLTLVMLAIAGFSMVLNNAATNTLLQGLVPDALRGRVMSLWTFVFVGFAPLGSLQVGWIGEYLGAGWAVAIGGLIAAGASVYIWFFWAREVGEIR